MKISKIQRKNIKKRSYRTQKGGIACKDMKGKNQCTMPINKKNCFWLPDCNGCAKGKCKDLSAADKKRGYNTFDPYKKHYAEEEAEDVSYSYENSTE